MRTSARGRKEGRNPSEPPSSRSRCSVRPSVLPPVDDRRRRRRCHRRTAAAGRLGCVLFLPLLHDVYRNTVMRRYLSFIHLETGSLEIGSRLSLIFWSRLAGVPFLLYSFTLYLVFAAPLTCRPAQQTPEPVNIDSAQVRRSSEFGPSQLNGTPAAVSKAGRFYWVTAGPRNVLKLC